MDIYSIMSWVFYIAALITLFRVMVVWDITSLAYLVVAFACIALTKEFSKQSKKEEIKNESI